MLIGLAGHKRSGKDTAAAHLCRRFGFVTDTFAAPIRSFVTETLGMTQLEMESCKESPIDWLPGFTPRALMQTVGTEWGRQTVHADLWVLSAMRRADVKLGHGARGVVLADIRFANEAEAVRERGGFVIRLTRPAAKSDDTHSSEVRLPDSLIDVEVMNPGTLDDLYLNLDGAMRHLRVEPVYVHG